MKKLSTQILKLCIELTSETFLCSFQQCIISKKKGSVKRRVYLATYPLRDLCHTARDRKLRILLDEIPFSLGFAMYSCWKTRGKALKERTWYFLTGALTQWGSQPTWGWHEETLWSLERWGALRNLRICGEGNDLLPRFCPLLEEDFTWSLSLEHAYVTDWTAFSHFPVIVPGSRRALSYRSPWAKPPVPPTSAVEVVVSQNTQPANYPKISFIARKVSYLIHRPTKTNKTKNHKFFLTNTWLQIYTVSFFRY